MRRAPGRPGSVARKSSACACEFNSIGYGCHPHVIHNVSVVTGGIPIIDYKVLWDYGQGGDFVEIVDTTTGDKLYTKDEDIVEGTTYQFKVVSVNAVGESGPSGALSVIAA